MPLHITAALLRQHGACAGQLAVFVKTFGEDGTVLTPESWARAKAAGLALEWCAVLLSPPVRQAYEAQVEALRQAHAAQVKPLWEAYDAQVKPLWEAYEAQVEALRQAHAAQVKTLLYDHLLTIADDKVIATLGEEEVVDA